jgi:phage baseplate assembly protein W
LYDFGANLRPLLTELVSSDDFDGQIMERISNAVARWMPYVSLENFESKIDRSKSGSESLAHINVKITYSVPSLGVSNKLLEITLNAM